MEQVTYKEVEYDENGEEIILSEEKFDVESGALLRAFKEITTAWGGNRIVVGNPRFPKSD